MRLDHTSTPVYDKDSRILILGSFPSVRSRAEGFYYGHPRNRFWRVIAAVFDAPVPESIEEKQSLLREKHIALWDVCSSCEIDGSSDASIREVIPNYLSPILGAAKIERVFTNGSTAARLYRRYQLPLTGIEAHTLPSTSPANAAFDLRRLIDEWRVTAKLLRLSPHKTAWPSI